VENRSTPTCRTSTSESWGRIKGAPIYLQCFTLTVKRGKNRGLPPPLRPNARHTSSDEDDFGKGTLSDYSDYDTSDEETHNRIARNVASSSNDRRAYPGASDLDLGTKKGLLDEDDPFADPFGDSHGVDDSSSILDGVKQKVW